MGAPLHDRPIREGAHLLLELARGLRLSSDRLRGQWQSAQPCALDRGSAREHPEAPGQADFAVVGLLARPGGHDSQHDLLQLDTFRQEGQGQDWTWILTHCQDARGGEHVESECTLDTHAVVRLINVKCL
jgi:hypothetical protein